MIKFINSFHALLLLGFTSRGVLMELSFFLVCFWIWFVCFFYYSHHRRSSNFWIKIMELIDISSIRKNFKKRRGGEGKKKKVECQELFHVTSVSQSFLFSRHSMVTLSMWEWVKTKHEIHNFSKGNRSGIYTLDYTRGICWESDSTLMWWSFYFKKSALPINRNIFLYKITSKRLLEWNKRDTVSD